MTPLRGMTPLRRHIPDKHQFAEMAQKKPWIECLCLFAQLFIEEGGIFFFFTHLEGTSDIAMCFLNQRWSVALLNILPAP